MAYETLSDSEKRRVYDQVGEREREEEKREKEKKKNCDDEGHSRCLERKGDKNSAHLFFSFSLFVEQKKLFRWESRA